jgi:ferredoxin
MTGKIYSVVAEKCFRCAACSTLAPGIFAMGETSVRVLRQPSTPEEVTQAQAALFNCPVSVIRRGPKEE